MVYTAFLGPICNLVMYFIDPLGLQPKQNDDVGAESCRKQPNKLSDSLSTGLCFFWWISASDKLQAASSGERHGICAEPALPERINSGQNCPQDKKD